MTDFDLAFVDVTAVRHLGGHRLGVRFSDGSEGERDFAPIVAQSGLMAQPLRDPGYFARVFIEYGALAWPNGFDLDPIALHAEMKAAGLLRRSAA